MSSLPIRVCLTGSTGFLGRRLVHSLLSSSAIDLTATARVESKIDSLIFLKVGEINSKTDWSAALYNQEVVIHTAARAHLMNDLVEDPLTEFRKVNVAGSLNLARQAAKAGVKRFIFISSIKVNGEQTTPGNRFLPEDYANPSDPYGISKWEAELGLQKIARETNMELVVIRPPLVYGPGVKGNFASLIKLAGKGLPLPLGSIHNRRSMIALDNLVDLVITCIDHPNAANQIFLASDGQDLSTTALLEGLARAMGAPARLLPIPGAFLSLAASVLGKKSVADRLLGSLQVDISKTRCLLSWAPPISVDEGLRRCFESKEV